MQLNDNFSLLITRVNFVYPDGKHQLQNINLTLNSGTIIALLGANGSGKSTLFKCLTNQYKPTTGKILLDQISIDKVVNAGMVSYVPQLEEIDLDFPISVFDVIAQGRYPYINWLRILNKQDHQIVLDAAKELGIDHILNYQISQLSGGQRKRMFLARALAQQARIIFLDEPFTGVDVHTELKIMEILQEHKKKGKLILVATHNISKVPQFCDQVVHISNHRAEHGDVNQMLQKLYKDHLVGV